VTEPTDDPFMLLVLRCGLTIANRIAWARLNYQEFHSGNVSRVRLTITTGEYEPRDESAETEVS
jgi:hypothetical protein